jgi:hypothetical protein
MIANYVVDFVLDPSSSWHREKLCNDILEQKPSHVFLNIAWEAYKFSPSMLEVDDFLFQHGIPTTWVIWDITKTDPAWQQLRCSVVFLNFIFWRSYNQIVVKKLNATNQYWNSNAEKFLFLTGKPNKPQRIRLLHKFHQQGLMPKCSHSLFMHSGMYEASRRVVQYLSDREFADFVQQYQHNPDNIVPDMQETSMHYGGIPYNPDLYANSLVRVVSETNVDHHPPALTEKTYLTIVNKNPFVIAGDRYSCRYLKSLGFETFDQLFDIPTYDDISNVDARLDHVVNHVRQWLLGSFNKTQVADMVEHNYRRFLTLGQQTKQEFENITGVDIDQAVSTRDPQSNRW